VEVVATDADRRWTVHAADDAPAAPVAEVAGPAASLALLLWGRTTADDPHLAVAGDRAAVRATLGGSLTP